MPRKKASSTRTLPYRPEDYLYRVAWSEEDQLFIGRVDEFSSLAAHGETQMQALQEITNVVKLVMEDLMGADEAVPEPFSKRRYSGRLNLRMPESLHRNLTIEAAQQNISLNQLITLKLSGS